MKRKSNIIFNIICLFILLSTTIFLVIMWNKIPSVVVTHYDFMGHADGFGKKSSILLSPIMAWVIFISITVLSLFPSIWNTGVTIKEENRDRVYGVILNMLNILKTVIVFVFCYITVCTALEYRLPGWLTVVEIIAIFGTIIVSIVKLYKVR